MSDNTASRRDFLKLAALGLAGTAGVALGANLTGRAAHKSKSYGDKATSPESATWPIKLGAASYSLRALSRAEAIAGIKEMGVKYVCIKSFHLPYELTPEELAAGRKEFEEAGLTIVGGGVVSIQEDNDDAVRESFEYAKLSGMPLMVIASTPEVMPRVEKFVKEYDIKVAIHNHGPGDEYFPAPSDALEVIKDMDPRVGVCVDVGHTTRTGADILEEIANAGDRVLDVHMKDLKDLMKEGTDCIIGQGAMPVVEIFKQLKKMKYSGYVNLEYEADMENPVPGMIQSFAYMRGVLAVLEEG